MTAYVRSILSADGVAELIREHYGLEATGVTLVRSLVNELYRVETDTGRFAFKVYRTVDAPRAHSIEAVAWEQDLAGHLIRAGMRVTAPITLLTGHQVGQLDAPEGIRPFALNAWLSGTKPEEPTPQLYREFGALTARFHHVATGFVSEHRREPVNGWESLAETTEQVLGSLTETDERELVVNRSAMAGRRLADLSSILTWGVRHGDVSLDNVLVDDGVLTLHDFDLARPGWLVADLTGVRSTAQWGPFLSGYRSVGELSEEELEALPALRIMDLIFNLRFHLTEKPLIFGSESRAEGWIERELSSLREADLSP